VAGHRGRDGQAHRVTSLREKGKARRKQQIIQAAKRLLAAGGIDGLSTRKLAEEAELSVHTLYALVGSKDKILEAVMQDNHNRVLGDIIAINARNPIEQIFAFVDSTYGIIAEDEAAQKPLMRVLMTLFDQGALGSDPWWMMAQEKGWMLGAVAEAIDRELLAPDFPAPVIADMLMKIYLTNLRDFLFDRCGLEAYRDRATFELWFCLSNIAADRTRADYAAQARAAAARLQA
jgi:AcrR family transcriptional regulator